MQNSYFYKAEEVREVAKGQWLFVLAHLVPELEPALKKAGKRHVTCPFHGGKNDFRMFKDAHDTGGAICTCGKWHDGFELIRHGRGWDFKECLVAVGDAVGAPKHFKRDSTKVCSQQTSSRKQAPARVNNTTYNPDQQPNYRGTLIAHGSAPYQDVSENDASYFAFVRFQNGSERKIWGIDLERAIAEAGASYGDQVSLTNLGREPVTVMAPEVDSETGEILSEKPISVHRNTWVVEVLQASAASACNAGTEYQSRVVNENHSHGHDQPCNEVSASAEPVSVPAMADCDQTVQQPHESNVVPLFESQPKPWLAEIQEEMAKRAEREKVNNARLSGKIQSIWDECLPINSPAADPLRLYLNSRKLMFVDHLILETDSMRFHPCLPYYDEDGNKVGDFPAAVMAIRNPEGTIVTLHRTYLTKNGKKAKVPCAKKMMPVPEEMKVTGGAVHLGHPVDGILGVAEGMETALSGYRGTKIPTWSTVNATLLENFEVPAYLEGKVHTIVIFADKDKSHTGERSANVLKAKLEAKGYAVHVLLPSLPIPPKSKGIDWNDMWITQGVIGFPSLKHLRTFIRRSQHGSV